MSALTEKEEARTNALGVLHIVLIVLSVCGAGCVAYLPSAVSTNPVGTLYERPVDVVSGHSSEYYILGLGPLGNASLQAAVEDALSNKRSSSLANVYVDRRMIGFPMLTFALITRVDTMVYGTLVSYGGEEYVGPGGYGKPREELSALSIAEMTPTHTSEVMEKLYDARKLSELRSLMKRIPEEQRTKIKALYERRCKGWKRGAKSDAPLICGRLGDEGFIFVDPDRYYR